jgi:hypothetical protein
MMTHRLTASLSIAVLCLAACGGPKGKGGDEPAETFTVFLDPALDGYIAKKLSTQTFTYSDSGMGIRVGDMGDDFVLRGLLNFDISMIPADATIVSAVLRVERAQVFGDPYGQLSLGALGIRVWDVNLGLALKQSDFDSGTSGPDLVQAGGLESQADVTGVVDAAMTLQQKDAGFRLQFAAPFNAGAGWDHLVFQDDEGSMPGAAQKPQLMVTYTVPQP